MTYTDTNDQSNHAATYTDRGRTFRRRHQAYTNHCAESVWLDYTDLTRSAARYAYTDNHLYAIASNIPTDGETVSAYPAPIAGYRSIQDHP